MTGSTRLKRIDRQARIALLLGAGFIVAFSFLVLSLTVWHQPESAEPELFYTTLPGVSMEGIRPLQADAVLKKLNTQRCHCGCMRTMASCRNHHDSCTESLATAVDEVNAALGR